VTVPMSGKILEARASCAGGSPTDASPPGIGFAGRLIRDESSHQRRSTFSRCHGHHWRAVCGRRAQVHGHQDDTSGANGRIAVSQFLRERSSGTSNPVKVRYRPRVGAQFLCRNRIRDMNEVAAVCSGFEYLPSLNGTRLCPSFAMLMRISGASCYPPQKGKVHYLIHLGSGI